MLTIKMACDCILLNITKQEIFLTYSKVSKLFHIEHLRNFSETPQFHYFKIILNSQILENNPTIRHTITIKKKTHFAPNTSLRSTTNKPVKPTSYTTGLRAESNGHI